VSDLGAFGFEFLQSYGEAIATRKAAPMAATQVNVVRDGVLTAINNGLGPRELDFVRVILPTYNIDQIVQVAGLVLDETQATQTYFLINFPEAKLAQSGLQRLPRSIDFLATTYNR